MTQATKHVFILGAGFSFPLGGPLFRQLLTRQLYYCVSELEIPRKYTQAIEGLHERNAMRKNSVRRVESRLEVSEPLNAEQLLELIDWVIHNLDKLRARRVISAILGDQLNASEFDSFRKQVKRVIAAQCQQFLQEIDEESERLKPFIAWMKSLTPRDAIVTFNYDSAIEFLAKIASVNLSGSPGTHPNDAPRMYKLHGSVNWQYSNGQLEYHEGAYRYAETDLAIGLPGSEKSGLPTHPMFESIWLGAKQEIQRASHIAIVGYSMPETDNLARDMIVGAIADNENVRSINIVLGANGGSTAERIHALIRPVLNASAKAGVSIVPMYAQDYIARHKQYYADFEF